MLTEGEKDATKVLLEFLKRTFPLFEEFLTLFQKSTPTIHLASESNAKVPEAHCTGRQIWCYTRFCFL